MNRKFAYISASTSELYGNSSEIPQRETTPFAPRSPYGVARLYAYWIEFTVPLCRSHHRDLHRTGNEVRWWAQFGIQPKSIAYKLWTTSHPEFVVGQANRFRINKMTLSRQLRQTLTLERMT